MRADDDVVTAVFKAHGFHTPAELRGVLGDTALARFDQSVCELMKRHNAVQHAKSSRAQVLATLEEELKKMESDEAFLTGGPSGDSEDGQKLRQLENRLDKVVIKNNESKYIRKTYQAILEKLQEVHSCCNLCYGKWCVESKKWMIIFDHFWYKKTSVYVYNK